MIASVRIFCLAMFFPVFAFSAAGEDFTNGIAADLQHYVTAQLPHGRMVVGLVDEHGPRVISCGDLDNGTDRQADGGTLFNIQSATYTFFYLLLQDMVDHGEMQPEDPVAKWLPASVKMPAYHRKQITIRYLAKETSGFRPALSDGLDPEYPDDPLAGYAAEKFFAAVSNCRLTAESGTTHLHGGAAGGVLNQAMALKGGTDIKSLLRARVLAPLHMNDTRLTLAPEMESRLAPKHSKLATPYPDGVSVISHPWPGCTRPPTTCSTFSLPAAQRHPS
jgi:CubicO group peptidase (beta-lactamase class C family)